jgi:hypothetical protein
MDGPLLAEFSSLNALSQKAPPARVDTSKSTSGPRHSAANEHALRNEQLLRGESTYTAVSSDGRANDHFIEDAPQSVQYGVSHLLPKESTTEERERLLRRLEKCAEAREESSKIMSLAFAQHDAVKASMRRERQTYFEKLSSSQRERDERWSRKLQRSPFAVDLVAENQRIDEENRVRDHVEQRRQRLMAKRNREAHNSIFERATAETDELQQLRTEKRLLFESERQLKALRDVEKSNAFKARILQERRQQQALRQESQAQQDLLSQLHQERRDREKLRVELVALRDVEKNHAQTAKVLQEGRRQLTLHQPDGELPQDSLDVAMKALNHAREKAMACETALKVKEDQIARLEAEAKRVAAESQQAAQEMREQTQQGWMSARAPRTSR